MGARVKVLWVYEPIVDRRGQQRGPRVGNTKQDAVYKKIAGYIREGFQEILDQLGQEDLKLLVKFLVSEGCQIAIDNRFVVSIFQDLENIQQIQAGIAEAAPPPQWKRQKWPPRALTLMWVDASLIDGKYLSGMGGGVQHKLANHRLLERREAAKRRRRGRRQDWWKKA